jgi:hypothetical protein
VDRGGVDDRAAAKTGTESTTEPVRKMDGWMCMIVCGCVYECVSRCADVCGCVWK